MRSVTTQKKTMWIPIVNYVNIILFIFTCHKSITKAYAELMLFVYFGLFFGVGAAIHVFLSFLLPEGSLVLFGYTLYAFPVLMNFGLIKYQEKYLNN